MEIKFPFSEYATSAYPPAVSILEEYDYINLENASLWFFVALLNAITEYKRAMIAGIDSIVFSVN